MSTLLPRRPRSGGRVWIAGRIRARTQRERDGSERPRWQAAVSCAAWSVVGVLGTLEVLMLMGWVASDTTAGPLDAATIGAYGWLLGHGVPLAVDLGPDGVGMLSMHPLGLLLIMLTVLYRTGSMAARASGVRCARDVGVLVTQICLTYALLVTCVAALTLDGPARPNIGVAVMAGLVVPLLGAGPGVLRGSGSTTELRARLPLDLRVALDAGFGAVLVLVSGAALVLAASMLVHFPRVVGLTGALGPDLTGWPLLFLLNVLLLPNAGMYALAVATGPGFALGAGTSVSLGGASVGALPALSLLGAVPDGVAAPAYAFGVLLVPLAAGVTAGLLAFARAPGCTAERAAVRGCYAGLVSGCAIGVLARASGGALGTERLTQIGPNGWLVGLVVAVQVGVIAAVTAWVGCPRTAVAVVAAPKEVTAATVSIAPSAESTADRQPAPGPTMTPAATKHPEVPGPAESAAAATTPAPATPPSAEPRPAAPTQQGPPAAAQHEEETVVVRARAVND